MLIMIKKVYQDKFGKGGNCASAVHASMFGLTLDEVPYYNDGLGDLDLPQSKLDHMFNERVDTFLATMGFKQEWYLFTPELVEELKTMNYTYRTYYEVIGKSPRGYNHVVIYKDGELYHDPHPDGGGVEETYICLYYKI